MPRPALLVTALLAATAVPIGAQCADGSPPPCAQARPVASAVRPLDPNRIAIFPFRITTSDTLLGEGFAELLATEFTGEGVPRSVDMATVLNEWRAAGGGLRTPLVRARAIQLARSLGAATLTEGSIVGLGRNITVTINLINTADGSAKGVGAQISAPGDSLDVALRQVASTLLASIGGQQKAFLGTRYTNSPEAMRAYLVGLANWRRGRLSEAVVALDQAIAQDSSFAQAIFRRYLAALWSSGTAPYQQLVWNARTRLAPQERIVLEGVMGSEFPKPRTIEMRLRDRERAAQLLPDSPEAQYLIGDYWYHYGSPVDPVGQAERARTYFLRAISIDSQTTVLRHLIEIALFLRDTSLLRRIVPSYLKTEDSGLWGGAWLAAATTGDSSMLAALRGRSFVRNPREVAWPLASAVTADLARPAMDEFLKRYEASVAPESRAEMRAYGGMVLGIRGRPAAADSILANASAGARQAADRLVLAMELSDAGLGLRPEPVVARLASRRADSLPTEDRCVLAVRRAVRGDAVATPDVPPQRCAALLRAWESRRDSSAAGLAAAEVADSTLRNSLANAIGYEGYILAQVWLAHGMPDRALRAIRYRPQGLGFGNAIWTLPSEGRLALAVGDTSGAVRAYTLWLQTTQGAESVYTPKRDSIRAELTRLTRRIVP